MGKFFDELAADVEYAAEVQDGGRGEEMPRRSEIGTDPLSAELARRLRKQHAKANAYRMAEAIAAEISATWQFESEYGELPDPSDLGSVTRWIFAVLDKVKERGGALEAGEQLGGDVIAQLLAAADGDDDEDAGAGRAARVEEPRPMRGEEAR